MSEHETKEWFEWSDFEPEQAGTGDGSGDPDKHILTITGGGDEIAVIVHRTCDGKFPINGPLAEQKRTQANYIVDALNYYTGKRGLRHE